jgi:hypothetical protein
MGRGRGGRDCIAAVGIVPTATEALQAVYMKSVACTWEGSSRMGRPEWLHVPQSSSQPFLLTQNQALADCDME